MTMTTGLQGDWQLPLSIVACIKLGYFPLSIAEGQNVHISMGYQSFGLRCTLDNGLHLLAKVNDNKPSALEFLTTDLRLGIHFVCGCINDNITLRRQSSVNKISFILKHWMWQGSSMVQACMQTCKRTEVTVVDQYFRVKIHNNRNFKVKIILLQ